MGSGIPGIMTSLAHTDTYHDGLVTHIELRLSRDQGLPVLLDNPGGPAEDILVLCTDKARDKEALIMRLLCLGPVSSWLPAGNAGGP
jgi:hypothetical protein